jgi:hypothetical protein
MVRHGEPPRKDRARRVIAVASVFVGLWLVLAAPSLAAPTVSYQCSPAPTDCTGWYRSDVALHWTVDPPKSVSQGCTDATFTADTAGTPESCTAGEKDKAVTAQVTIRRDATPPKIVAAVARRTPDHAGWFTAPVTFDFVGTDATSGLAACAPARYAGPDGAAAKVVGTCRDNAGNQSRRSFGLMFDATPPPVSGLRGIGRDRRVVVRWHRIRDAASIEVRRVPGVGVEPTSLVLSGGASRFVDHNVRNGVAYRYEVRPTDAAGNTGSDAVTATPRRTPPHLRLPLPGALIRASTPPLLRWTSVRRARYYNVQLYRNDRKVLSAWPQRPRYQIERFWRYAGEERRLSPGRYVWYVWPGYGDRSQVNYGDLVGQRAFVVAR